MEFLAWLIHQFAPIVCFKGSRKDYLNKFLNTERPNLDWMSPDDFAYIFLVLQHSINKWKAIRNLMKERAMEARIPESEFLYDNLNTAEVKKIEGYECAAGAGLSSTLAQACHRSIMIMFNRAFLCPENDQRDGNLQAICSTLKELADTEWKEMEASEARNGPSREGCEKKKKSAPVSSHPEYDNF